MQLFTFSQKAVNVMATISDKRTSNIDSYIYIYIYILNLFVL